MHFAPDVGNVTSGRLPFEAPPASIHGSDHRVRPMPPTGSSRRSPVSSAGRALRISGAWPCRGTAGNGRRPRSPRRTGAWRLLPSPRSEVHLHQL